MNLPKWQVLSCVGSFSNVVDSSTPLRCGRSDKTGGTFSGIIGNSSVLSGAERHIGRSGGVANTTRADERNRSPTCHSEGAQRVEESSQVASFILCWFFLQRGGFLHSAVAQGPNDKGKRFYGFAYCFYNVSGSPAAPHQARPGEPASPEGSSCTVLLGLRFAGTAQGKAPRSSPSGKGNRHR